MVDTAGRVDDRQSSDGLYGDLKNQFREFRHATENGDIPDMKRLLEQMEAMVDTAERLLTAQEIKAGLEAPFEAWQIKERQGAYGKALSYIDGPTVYRRLNDATNRWDFVIDRSYFDDMYNKQGEISKVMVVEGHLTIPELGTRAGTGVQVLSPGSGEDMYKGARTDAIKNAASLFGVGLDLYDSGMPPLSVQPQQQYQPQQQGGYQQTPQDGYQQQAPQPQQGQFQRATGDRVPGGATVKQVNAIKAIADKRGVDEQSLAMMVARATGGGGSLDPQDCELNSRAASGLIDQLQQLPE